MLFPGVPDAPGTRALRGVRPLFRIPHDKRLHAPVPSPFPKTGGFRAEAAQNAATELRRNIAALSGTGQDAQFTLEMPAQRRAKLAYKHFAARIGEQILAERIGYLQWRIAHGTAGTAAKFLGSVNFDLTNVSDFHSFLV
jgi:hypothetical protein